MAEIINVNKIEQLKQFANDKNLIEVLVRDGKKRYKTFYNIAINSLQQEEKKEIAEKVLNAVNKNGDLLNKGINQLNNIAALQGIGLVLNGLNLCATVVGFTIMNKKLNEMSASIERQFNEIKIAMKKENDMYSTFEFNKVLGEHMAMLDRRKIKKPYSEEKMRELVDMESNTLKLLTDMLKYDIASNKETLIISILSMLSMLTVSLRYFDEMYYISNSETIGDGDKWHGSHDFWMNSYDVLSSAPFVKLIQECGFISMNLNTEQTDVLYLSFYDQVKELKQDVLDNMTLVSTVGNLETIKELKEQTCNEVKSAIEDAFKEAFSQSSETKKVYKEVLNQVVQAA